MKNTIIQRHVDELGRVVVPIDFRQKLGIHMDIDTEVYLSVPSEDGIFTMAIDYPQCNAIIQANLGFLILPQTYRFENDLNNCMIDFWIEDGKLCMKKTVPQCLVTGETENLVRYKDSDKYLSESVIIELYESLNKK